VARRLVFIEQTFLQQAIVLVVFRWGKALLIKHCDLSKGLFLFYVGLPNPLRVTRRPVNPKPVTRRPVTRYPLSVL